MRFDNVLTKMLGVKYPIIQGAFGWPGTGTSKIAVPVLKAGAQGILTTICYKNPDEFQEDIKIAKAATDKPLAVNFTIMKGSKYDNEYHKDYVKIALNEGIKTAFTSAYDGSYIGKQFKDAGCNWIHKCATIKHAVSIAKKGADAVVIVGLEGTGYKSPEQNTTLINMTAAKKIIDIPLIAAGGIGNANGFVAALAMGASGVYIGTAFMTTKEFQVPDDLKKKIVNQNIMDADYCKKVYSLEHGAIHSLSSGVIDSVTTVKEYIDTMVKESKEIVGRLKKWGL